MRIIYNKTTNKVTGIIAERVTDFIPATFSGEDSTYIDISYNNNGLKRSSLARVLEKEGVNLIGKIIHIDGKKVWFEEAGEKQYQETVMVNIDNPKLHKDVEIYSKKGRDKGATVEIEDITSVIMVKIKDKDRVVGVIRLQKRGCCTYVYQEGNVIDRDFYPHYVGFESIIKYLKGKVKWLDMGGLLSKGKDDDLNKFKKKWGETKLIEVTWQ